MAKCPFCGSQFQGKELQIHIHTKHRDQEDTFERIVPARKPKSKVQKRIVVDGNNVAYTQGKPEVSNIKLCRAFLKRKQYEPIIIISSALRHQIDKPLELIRMINLNWVIEAEPGENDDILIIETAFAKQCKIISNDRYLDHNPNFNWDIQAIILNFQIINKQFKITRI
ncbi:MAG: hypothetical protein INQ03_20530 [Candidatus Heimdallarchaeota archaeon]|nr:hypothetical protein [Candidatus Heimdallarchaeota archaeon]